MHIQARTLTSASPADLGALLEKLAEPANGNPPINIEGVAGDHLEMGGQFVFSFDHDRVDDVIAAIGDYKGFEIVTGNLDLIEQPPSAVADDDELHVRCSAGTARRAPTRDPGRGRHQPANHRVIRNVVIGQETGSDRFYVQITFKEVRRPSSTASRLEPSAFRSGPTGSVARRVRTTVHGDRSACLAVIWHITCPNGGRNRPGGSRRRNT